MPVIENEYLVSSGAQERYERWRRDLKYAESQEEAAAALVRKRKPSAQLETKDTPGGSMKTLSPPPTPADAPNPEKPQADSPDVLAESGPSAHVPETPHPRFVDPPSYDSHYKVEYDSESAIDDNLEFITSPPKRTKINARYDGSGDYPSCRRSLQISDVNDDGEDKITDTVGAVAIDAFGKIAAGSSSGGIGMKHKGRCGPAALVGIGTAVIPAHPEDPDQMCCASVTSGTGEHMATTQAASIASDRIYHSVKRENGRLVTCSEEEAMKYVIDREFMKHPGVANSHCVGAICIMSVKKSKDGVWFYFGHNTDSFALASMSGEEKKPVCTMSRNRGHQTIAGGGRSIRSKHTPSRR